MSLKTEQRAAQKQLKARWKEYNSKAMAQLLAWLQRASYGSKLTFEIGRTATSPYTRLVVTESSENAVADIPGFERPD